MKTHLIIYSPLGRSKPHKTLTFEKQIILIFCPSIAHATRAFTIQKVDKEIVKVIHLNIFLGLLQFFFKDAITLFNEQI